MYRSTLMTRRTRCTNAVLTLYSTLPTVSPHRPLLSLLVLVVLLRRDNKVTGDDSTVVLLCCAAAVRLCYSNTRRCPWLWLSGCDCGYTSIQTSNIALITPYPYSVLPLDRCFDLDSTLPLQSLFSSLPDGTPALHPRTPKVAY